MGKLSPAGKIGRLFGPVGGLSVTLYDTFPDSVNYEEPLFVVIDGLTVPLFMEHFERRGRRGAVIRFADIDNEERATELLGLEIMLSGDDTSPKKTDNDEIYWDDLAGYTVVINERGRAGEPVTGTIAGFVDNEMNPLLKIDSSGNEILIPATDDFITGIDTGCRKIEFELPEGLLELYL